MHPRNPTSALVLTAAILTFSGCDGKKSITQDQPTLTATVLSVTDSQGAQADLGHVHGAVTLTLTGDTLQSFNGGRADVLLDDSVACTTALPHGPAPIRLECPVQTSSLSNGAHVARGRVLTTDGTAVANVSQSLTVYN